MIIDIIAEILGKEKPTDYQAFMQELGMTFHETDKTATFIQEEMEETRNDDPEED